LDLGELAAGMRQARGGPAAGSTSSWGR